MLSIAEVNKAAADGWVVAGFSTAASRSNPNGSDTATTIYSFPRHIFVEASEAVTMIFRPNKSPEPTAVGAFSSAIAVHVASRRWLSFFR